MELQRRSHLVIVDGMDDPATRQTLLAMVDTRVLVVEPTSTGAAMAARLMARIGPMIDQEWPVVLVQNHTRALEARAGARALAGAGIASAPHVVVPFEPSLPSIADRGWPQGRLPRTLREPLGILVDNIEAASDRDGSMAAAHGSTAAHAASRTSAKRAGRSRRSRGPAKRSRPSPVRAALRRFLPLGTARTRPA